MPLVGSAIDGQQVCHTPGELEENRQVEKVTQDDSDVDMAMDLDAYADEERSPFPRNSMSKSPLGQQKQMQTERDHQSPQQQRYDRHLVSSGKDQQSQLIGPYQQGQHLIPGTHPDVRPFDATDTQQRFFDDLTLLHQPAVPSSDIELDSARNDPADPALIYRSQSRPRKTQARIDSGSTSSSDDEPSSIKTGQGRSFDRRSSAKVKRFQDQAKGRGKWKSKKAKEILISASSPSNTHRSPSTSLFQAVPPDHHHYSPLLHISSPTHTDPHAETTSPPFTRQSSSSTHQYTASNDAAYPSAHRQPTAPVYIAQRPDPLRIVSSSSSASAASSLRSARRLTHSPYLVPPTARFAPTTTSLSPNMVAATPMITVKDEPRTPMPLPTSPDGMDDRAASFDLPLTPQQQRSVHSPGSRIGSSPGSMSMSQRRGVKPSFPGARAPTRGGPATRGLPTPLYSASSRQPPYPSPVPLLTAPLSPTKAHGSRWHQSAPAVPMTAVPSKTPHQPNPYQVSLDEIPKDFVLKKLVQLASKYWYAPHSADCHIIVPIKRQSSSSTQIPTTPRTAIPPLHQRQCQHDTLSQTAGAVQHESSEPGSSFWKPPVEPTLPNVKVEPGLEEDVKPDVLSSSVKTTTQGVRDPSARRGSLPGDNQLEQCLVFPLHKDYLTTQSVLFRTLLNSQAAQIPNPPPRDENGRLLFQSPVIRGAKVLPTKAERPKALYVPLPDPASFGVILHWLYWHDTDHFNHCLSKGLVTWQGVIRNIEYLALDNEIKLLAGKWWKRWVKPTEPTERRKTGSASVNGLGSGKKRATSVSTGMKRAGDDDDDDDEDEDEDGDGVGGDPIDSGDEADEEDLEANATGAGKASVVDDSFADHVSARFGRL
ncbi:hypothetical protein IAU59_002361 [Kwoniella sp. CBS 9459]